MCPRCRDTGYDAQERPCCGVAARIAYPCSRCHGLGTLQGGGFCDCVHGTAARSHSRKVHPARRREGLTPVSEIAAGLKEKL
jgi:hypothetical protein